MLEADGERLDRALARAAAAIYRKHAPQGADREEGQICLLPRELAETLSEQAIYRVKSGQNFAISIPEPRLADPIAQAGIEILAVVYEDEEVIVVDKPAGLVVHPAPGNLDATLVNALLAHCGAGLTGIGGVARPGIVHRIDKDTSGLVVAAKIGGGARVAEPAIRRPTEVERVYQAFVWGMPTPAERRDRRQCRPQPQRPVARKWAVATRGGKTALTRYRVLARYRDQAAKVECRLATGRTHQIRVHFAHRGHPLLGDLTYGRDDRPAPGDARE